MIEEPKAREGSLFRATLRPASVDHDVSEGLLDHDDQDLKDPKVVPKPEDEQKIKETRTDLGLPGITKRE